MLSPFYFFINMVYPITISNPITLNSVFNVPFNQALVSKMIDFVVSDLFHLASWSKSLTSKVGMNGFIGHKVSK